MTIEHNERTSRQFYAAWQDVNQRLAEKEAEYAALLEQAQPVAWQSGTNGGSFVSDEARRNVPIYREVYTVPLYAAPVPPLTEFERMRIIGDEFPIALVEPIIIQKIDSVCRAIERKVRGA